MGCYRVCRASRAWGGGVEMAGWRLLGGVDGVHRCQHVTFGLARLGSTLVWSGLGRLGRGARMGRGGSDGRPARVDVGAGCAGLCRGAVRSVPARPAPVLVGSRSCRRGGLRPLFAVSTRGLGSGWSRPISAAPGASSGRAAVVLLVVAWALKLVGGPGRSLCGNPAPSSLWQSRRLQACGSPALKPVRQSSVDACAAGRPQSLCGGPLSKLVRRPALNSVRRPGLEAGAAARTR